jgi:hypothetical protein
VSEEASAGKPVNDAPIGFDVMRTVVGLLPPVALITGLLFYFGWVRVASVARALGQSDSVYGYTTTDYVLRSVGSLFFPLLVLTAAALLALIAHQYVQRALREGNALWARPVAWVLIGLGIALLCYGVLYALRLFEVQNSVMDVTGPLSLGVGALLIAYGGWLRSQSTRGTDATLPTWQRAFAAGMLMCIAALSLFWAVGNYAQVRGVQDARLIEASYRLLPAVVVYSARDLGLQPDAAVHPLTAGDTRYGYQYTCLRLLDHVQGTWYLLPENWAFNHRLIMLGDDPDVRFELTGAAETAPCPGID